MLKHKVKLSPEWVGFLKSKGFYPYKCGGFEFTEETEVVESELVKFAANPKYPYKRLSKELVLDPFLIFEAINEDSETTDTEQRVRKQKS